MDVKKLRTLLSQREGASLEFKKQYYQIKTGSQESRRRQKHELIKDILSLANGNESVIGQTSYLIIGVGDELNETGTRKLYDTRDSYLPTSGGLLTTINAYCFPPLSDIRCYPVPIDNVQVFVIEIPFSTHLHELIKKLDTPKRTYAEYTMFIRNNEDVKIASAAQRETVQTLKQKRSSEIDNHPALVGSMVGMFYGYISNAISPYQITDDYNTNLEISPPFGAAIGGIAGLAIGGAHQLKYTMQKKNPERILFYEILNYFIMLLGGFFTLFFAKEILKKIGLQQALQRSVDKNN